MKRTWAGELRNVSLLVASAVNAEGFREILGNLQGGQGRQIRLVGILEQIDRGLGSWLCINGGIGMSNPTFFITPSSICVSAGQANNDGHHQNLQIE
jgi:hypothetical protein